MSPAVLVLPWLLAGCAPEAPPPPPQTSLPPDVLLITIDTLRADRVGAYGDPLAKTPHLDQLAREGVLFREAHAVTPLTLPSHASLLTGLYPKNHGLRDNGGFRLAAGTPTLAAALSDQGYATAAFVSAFVLDSAWGLDAGFDTYRDPFHPQAVGAIGAFGEVELPGAEVVNAAVAWWRGQKSSGQPRFAWVHLYDPHTPWRDHPGWTGDPYRGEVAYADTLVGRLLKEVDADDLIVVTSDHGEGLWEHGEREHGVLLGRGVTRVPLIIRPPGKVKGSATPTPRPGVDASQRPEGVDPTLDLTPVADAPSAARVVDQPVSGVDIPITIAAAAGVELVADGRDLGPLLAGETMADQPVYAETFFPLFHHGWAALAMAQDAGARLEQGARDHAYAWPSDPTGATAVPAAPQLSAAIATWKGSATPSPGPIDSETAARLEALGYLTQAVPAGPDPADPRDAIGALSQLHAAELIQAPAARAAALKALVTSHPDMTDARIAWSLALAEAGDLEGARAASEAVLARWPDHPTALSNAAVLARQLGDGEAAITHARRMIALNPKDPRGYRVETAVWVDRGDAAEVLRVGRAGVAVAPEDPNLHYLVALAEIQAGDPLAGVASLEAARKHGTQATDISLWLGVAYEKAGEIDLAMKHYDAATREMSGDLRPWAMAGWMLYQAGRCKEANRFLINVARRGGARDAKVQEALQGCQGR